MWWCCSCQCSFATQLVYSEHLLCAHEEIFPHTRIQELPIGYTYTLFKKDEEDVPDEITDTETNLVGLKPLDLAKLKPCTIVAKRFDLESEHVFSVGTGKSVVFRSNLLENNDTADNNLDNETNALHDSSICQQCDRLKLGPDHQCLNVQKFSCEFCWQPFLNADNLIQHLKLCQSRADKFFCEECGRAFKKKHKLNIHRGGQSCLTKLAAYKTENQVVQFLQKPESPRCHEAIDISQNALETYKTKTVSFEAKTFTPRKFPNKKAKVKFTKTRRRHRPLNLVVPLVSVNNNSNKKATKFKKVVKSPKKVEVISDSIVKPNQNLPLNGFEFLRNTVEEFYSQAETINNEIRPTTAVEPNSLTWKPVRYNPIVNGIKQEVKTEPINGLCNDIISPVSLEGPDGILFCAECGLPCADLENLRKHVIKAKHEILERQVTVVVGQGAGKKLFVCKTCSGTFQSLDKAYFHAFLHVYPEHIRIMNEKKVFKCTVRKCQASFNTQMQLLNHQADHRVNLPLYGSINNKQKFKCPYCPRTYQIESTLRTHQQKEHSFQLNATHSRSVLPVNSSFNSIHAISNKRGVDCVEKKSDGLNSGASKKMRLDGIKLALNGFNCCTAFSNHHQRQGDDALVLHDEDCQRDKACLLCSTILNSKEELSDHYRLKHRNADIAGYQCQICKFPTASYVAFSQHVKNSHQAFFVCHMPEYGITQVVKSDLNVAQNLFTCDNCRQTFANFSRLRLHKIVSENLACKLCKQQCCTPADLVKHTKQRHPSQLSKLKNVQYVCKPCKKGYQSREKYTNHVAFHFSDTYNCVFCKELLLTNDELDCHLEKEHFTKVVSADFDLAKLRCPECLLQCASLKMLKSHIYESHFSTNVFICEVSDCMKVFRVKAHRENHVSRDHESSQKQSGININGSKVTNQKIDLHLTAISQMISAPSRRNGLVPKTSNHDESANADLSVFSVEPSNVNYSTKPNLIYLD